MMWRPIPDRLMALHGARDTGAPRATGRLMLVQETSQQFGLLIFLPLYSTGLPPDTVEARRQHLHGYVTGVFRIGDMMEAALRTFERKSLGLRLEDAMAPVGERLLYSHQWGGAGALVARGGGEYAARLHWRGTFAMAGRLWVLRVAPTLAYLTEHRSWYAWSIITCGVLFVGLLGAFLLVLTGRAVRTEQLVAERTTANAALEREIAERTRMGAALLESEARYRELFEHAHDMLYTHDLAGNFTALNRMGEQLTGYTRDELLALNISHIVAPEHLDLIQPMLARTHAGLPATMTKVDIVTKAGQRRTLEVSTQRIARAGSPVGGSGHCPRSYGTHAARSPAAAGPEDGSAWHLGRWHCARFQQYPDGDPGLHRAGAVQHPRREPTWHHLQAVRQAGQRAAALVQQILTFSRRTEQERTPTQLQLLIQETLQFLRATLPTTIALQQDLDHGVGPVLADAIQIHQVLLNLCTNAAHAMRETGGELHVRLEAIRLPTEDAFPPPGLGAGPYVRLTVQDTGHGMPPEIRDRIFEPFFTTKGPAEGTGMGLSVVHGIIASHGGAITVESTPRHGTTVRVYLPQSAQLPVASARPEAPLPQGRECILFVDDEEALAYLGDALLTALGYEVVALTSSVEALAVFQAAPDRFDLVITDHTMPQLTGEALAQALRCIRPTLPIILCTGFSETMTAEKAQALGIDAFCLKPFVLQELGHTIRRVLRQRRDRGEGPEEMQKGFPQ